MANREDDGAAVKEGRGTTMTAAAATPSPTLLKDDHGLTLLPTIIPPAIEFDDYNNQSHPVDVLSTISEHQLAGQGRDKSKMSNASEKRPSGEAFSNESDREGGDYFNARPPEHSVTRYAGETEQTDHLTPLRPVPKRMQTAPDYEESRPSVLPRRSSLLASIPRRATGASLNESRRKPYSYAFDPMSSESDTSSSESDNEMSVGKKKRPGQPSLRARTATTDFASEQKQKQRVKRGESYSRFSLGNENFRSKGRISKRDGRLNISINETANSGYVAKALGQGIRHHLNVPKRHRSKEPRDPTAKGDEVDEAGNEDLKLKGTSSQTSITRPRLNIVIMVIGSRGDIQPFLKIAKLLKEKYGHRVRIASHPTFREFVENDAGLEFFSVGGDPSELMAFMVKNPGLIPNIKTLREGEIQRRRAAMAVMFDGFWRACINTTDDEKDKANLKMMGEKAPFFADAIIANPPSMAHVHIAEKLGIPLHIMFTFPYTPTQQFPHPLANIRPEKSNVDESYVNFSKPKHILFDLRNYADRLTVSYPLVEMMTWQGLGDVVNKFREKTLRLEPVSSLWAPGALYRMKVPYTYLWSPSLVPKPRDWGPEIDIVGFVFLDLASTFKPDKELEDFLNAGEPPIYIGFGSIVVDDPDAFTDMIFKAADIAGVRALVNKGWGGLGRSNKDTPANIFMLGNTPHDWLFPRVKAVVHHGGAGTTAIGLKCAKPTMIVPFFGDQPFWGSMVAAAKAGAHKCIPYKKLTVEKLAEGIKQCLTQEAQENVQKIADSIAKEGDGAENAVKSFHRSLPLAGRHNMRCSILDDRIAVWQLRHSNLRLSALAAEVLHRKGKIKWNDLKLARHIEWNDFDGPGEPFTGGVGALKDSIYDIGEGMGMVPVRIAKHIRKHEEHQRRRAERAKRKEERRRRTAGQSKQKDVEQAPQPSHNATEPVASEENMPGLVRLGTNGTTDSALSSVPSETLPAQLAEDVREGVKKTGAAILTAPNDLHLAIAQGFHNAPRLWGDATVRKPIRITGFKSGCRAAGRELVLGVWDGCTGLVTQPIGDWKDADTLPTKLGGLGVGFGKGIGGFVLKNLSAAIAPPAFIGKGFIKYVEKKAQDSGSKGFIRKVHIIQGQRDLLALQNQERDDKDEQLRSIQNKVMEGWKVFQDVWDAAHQQYGSVGGNLVGRYKLRRKKKRWVEGGAFENVATANRAIHYQRRGGDLDHLFARRKKEMDEADEPRASAMNDPGFGEERAIPAGEEEGTSYAEREAENNKLGLSSPQETKTGQGDPDENPQPAQIVEEEGDSSDTTVVATPDEVANGKQKAAFPARPTATESLMQKNSDAKAITGVDMANDGRVPV